MENKKYRITFSDGSDDVAVLMFAGTYAFKFAFADGVQWIERTWLMAITELRL